MSETAGITTLSALHRQDHGIVTDDFIDLDPSIPGVAWLENFALGIGINAETGQVNALSALTPFEVGPPPANVGRFDYFLVEDAASYQWHLSTEASGSGNVEGVTLAGSASYATSVAYSSTTITIGARWSSRSSGYETITNPTLSAEAAALAKESPARFRERYGDYFVQGRLPGAMFVGLFVLEASSLTSMQEFKASFSASAPDIFSASGSVAFGEMINKHSLRKHIRIFEYGGDGPPPQELTPEGVYKALLAFQAKHQTVGLDAQLVAYFSLTDAIPSTLELPSRAWPELNALYSGFRQAEAAYRGTPEPYRRAHAKAYEALSVDIKANRAKLLNSHDLRLEYLNRVDALATILDVISERWTFWQKVVNSVEPPRDQYQPGGSGPQWTYGPDRLYDPKGTTVYSETKSDVRSPAGWLWHDFEFNYLAPEDRVIVRWRVTDGWDSDTNGRWCKSNAERGLGARTLKIKGDGKLNRGINWHLEVWTVSRAEFDFRD